MPVILFPLYLNPLHTHTSIFQVAFLFSLYLSLCLLQFVLEFIGYFDTFTPNFFFENCNNSGHLEQPTVGGSIDQDILKLLWLNTMITTACHCGPYTEPNEQRPHPHTLLYKMNFNIIL